MGDPESRRVPPWLFRDAEKVVPPIGFEPTTPLITNEVLYQLS